jgi:superfamily II DNA or RNA helicase
MAKGFNPIHQQTDSLFFQECFGIMIIDEAHELRTGGTVFDGLLLLRDKCLSVIALTATPLYTGARVRP